MTAAEHLRKIIEAYTAAADLVALGAASFSLPEDIAAWTALVDAIEAAKKEVDNG